MSDACYDERHTSCRSHPRYGQTRNDTATAPTRPDTPLRIDSPEAPALPSFTLSFFLSLFHFQHLFQHSHLQVQFSCSFFSAYFQCYCTSARAKLRHYLVSVCFIWRTWEMGWEVISVKEAHVFWRKSFPLIMFFICHSSSCKQSRKEAIHSLSQNRNFPDLR